MFVISARVLRSIKFRFLAPLEIPPDMNKHCLSRFPWFCILSGLIIQAVCGMIWVERDAQLSSAATLDLFFKIAMPAVIGISLYGIGAFRMWTGRSPFTGYESQAAIPEASPVS